MKAEIDLIEAGEIQNETLQTIPLSLEANFKIQTNITQYRSELLKQFSIKRE